MILIFGFVIIYIYRRCNDANELEEQKLRGMNPKKIRSNVKEWTGDNILPGDEFTGNSEFPA
jgi:hypothetical protein